LRTAISWSMVFLGLRSQAFFGFRVALSYN
jgi:hypothetical protein